MHHLIRLFLLLCLVSANTWAGDASTQAEDFRFETGLRYGFSYSGDRPHEFRQTDIFGNWNLPWQWHFTENWSIEPQLTASLGWLQQRHGGGFIGSLGPDLVIRRKNFPLVLVGGVGVTVLGRSSYEARDFGCAEQFNEHIGLNFEATRRFFLGYRFQHMSNADLALENPGLNLHMISAGFRF